MTDFLTFALDYADRGMAVFPLRPKDKTPLTPNGFKDATTDELIIENWWKRYPDANIGIATGKMSSGIFVIDIDVDEESGKDGRKSLSDFQCKYGNLPLTWRTRTGRGGAHLFFKAKDDEVKSRIALLAGVDVRGDGGYIVAPPSIHPNGTPYAWEYDLAPWEIDLSDADGTVNYLLQYKDKEEHKRYVAPAIIPKGERNGQMFKFACMMQAKGAGDNAVFASTMAENMEKCNPPLSEREVRQLVDSALKYDKGKPIYVNGEKSATQGKREPIFKTNDKGNITQVRDNYREAIQYDEALYGSIRYNELMHSIYVYGSLPWDNSGTPRTWSDFDDASLKEYLERKYGLKSTEKTIDSIIIVANQNKYHPVREMLEDIYKKYKDSCKGSIKNLLPEYMGAPTDEYTYEVLKLYMLGAISRVYMPGCKFDYSIILYGSQGMGKSEFLRRLALNDDWFNDNYATFEGDKAIEKLSGSWIIEMAELKALKSSKDSETFKAFLTSRIDKYRAPYSRRAEDRKRTCVFAGTTNVKNVFTDKTGNRRFLPIVCDKEKVLKSLFTKSESVTLDFERAWAEAMVYFKEANEHPELILPKEAASEAVKMQESFSEEDYRIGMIQNFLDAYEGDKVCAPLVIEKALNISLQSTTPRQRREVQEILDNEISGWERVGNKRGRLNFYEYGKQVAFMRSSVKST